MEQEKIYYILQNCNNQNPQQIVKKLKSEDGLVKNVIENLSNHYKKQVSHPIYNTLFQLYRSNDMEARCFVLQFVPSIMWIYLSAMTRRDKQGHGKLEAIFLAIYNTEVEKNGDQHNPKTFRLPSLSRPSIYHESSVDVMSQSALTESALSRHGLTETIIPGPKKHIDRITAANRMLVLHVALNQYNRSIAFMDKASHNSYWLMGLRVAISGFSKLCTPGTGASDLSAVISNEEQNKLANHPRIPIDAELILELIHGLYYLMYNGYRIQAAKAVDNLHFRAAHSLLAPAHVLSNAVHHSLIATGGLPNDGPLGLQVHLSDSKAEPVSPDTRKSLTALTTEGMSVTPSPMPQRRNNEINQTDGGLTENTSKETVLRIHTKSHSTGHWKFTFHPGKTEYELQTIPSCDAGGLGKESSPEQKTDANTTTKFEETNNGDVISTKF